jgi:DNA-directed RNA polymerase subunit RPC12/RpoP
MKLPKQYLEFIESCKIKKYSEITHNHHILPKFMGGTNTKNNYIKLGIDDHLMAHLILAENVDDIYKRKAWDSVTILKKGWGNNAEYILEQLRINSIGDKNNFYGRHHTNETKLKMKGNNSDLCGKTFEEIYGKDEATKKKNKISTSKMGSKNPMSNPIHRDSVSMGLKLHYTDTARDIHSNIMVSYYQTKAGIQSRMKASETIKNKKPVKCPYCSVESIIMSNIKRWHFDNCKNKPNGK